MTIKRLMFEEGFGLISDSSPPALSSFGPPESDFGVTSEERENYFLKRLTQGGVLRELVLGYFLSGLQPF